ncbi:hypothetical protein GPECTOR_84g319 [Gonium pectorale]|uniref:Uncharacterized protein n=1 Tax=Gonium pectorale TaxID=33097 RepID=A0A150G198_GONPE|nr:hypothetical protein GPECTOR_84g319 [Gonium pectorale]|eukprot:KXZ43643.1 hypothetical protein GPECTOR_84g319 [Gonium pectorale]
MLDGVVKARQERRYMIFVIVALCVFCLCTVGAVVGLTYAVVDALKDTQVTGDTMYVKGSSVEVVRTGSAEFAVVDGVFVNRQAQALANATSSAAAVAAAASNTTATTKSPSPTSVMRTASFMGSPIRFNSRVDVRSLMELKYLYIKGAGEVELALMVTGVARVPMEGSTYGTVVRIITTVGTITLDDTLILFSTDIADVFSEAGFRTTSISRNRRMLLGAYDVLGFFNFIRVRGLAGEDLLPTQLYIWIDLKLAG